MRRCLLLYCVAGGGSIRVFFAVGFAGIASSRGMLFGRLGIVVVFLFIWFGAVGGGGGGFLFVEMGKDFTTLSCWHC